MPSEHFRLVCNGFRCDLQTWDNMWNSDGWNDEVQLEWGYTLMQKDGTQLAGAQLNNSSQVIGDPGSQYVQVSAGHEYDQKNPHVGVATGDVYPPNRDPATRNGGAPN